LNFYHSTVKYLENRIPLGGTSISASRKVRQHSVKGSVTWFCILPQIFFIRQSQFIFAESGTVDIAHSVFINIIN
jgi:hypothetical protein